jgi:hypothetical protein
MTATWNPSDKHSSITLSESNLVAESTSYNTTGNVRSNKSKATGKYYFEVEIITWDGLRVGVCSSGVSLTNDLFSRADAWIMIHDVGGNAKAFHNNTTVDFGMFTGFYSGVHRVAVDFDAGKIWFGGNGTWFNSGNPATGANPTFSNITGRLFPVVSISDYSEATHSKVRGRFTTATFQQTMPSGFTEWGADEPLSPGNATVTISGQGTISFPSVQWITASAITEVSANGTLSYSAALVFSGDLPIIVENAGTLTVPRTLMESTAEIVIDLVGTMTEQPEYAIVATIMLSAQGSLEGIYNMIGNTTIGVGLSGTLSYETIVATALLEVPAPILTASANDFSNIQFNVTIPAPTLTAYTGGVTSLTVPAPVLTSTGTVQAVARAEMEVPSPELTATAANSTLASVAIEVPAPVLTAATGAYASLEVLAPQLTATGRVENLARVELTLPFIELIATATVGGMMTVEMEIPAPVLTATGVVGGVAQVTLTLPAVVLTSTAQVSPGAGLPATAVVTETTYTINLTTGAVTTLLLGSLDKLITAHGRLYGLRSGELIRLDGNLDGAATIPATVRFAPQTFNTNRAKRLSTVYLNTREDDGLTLEVVADEKTTWRYQTATDNAPAYGTHKVKTGRGIKFHTAGIILHNRNGGRMDVGGMELLVEPLSRRPKT